MGLLLVIENSRSPDLVEGRVLLVESLFGPPRVLGRPAVPLTGFVLRLTGEAVAEDFFCWESTRLLDCGVVPAFVVFERALPVLPLRARVFGYVMLSSSVGLGSRFRVSTVSRAICSVGIGTWLLLATGILEELFPLLLLAAFCASASSKISSGRLKSQLGIETGSAVRVSVVDVAVEFFLDLAVYSDPAIDLPELFNLSWLGSRLGLFWLFDLVLSLGRGRMMPAA